MVVTNVAYTRTSYTVQRHTRVLATPLHSYCIVSFQLQQYEMILYYIEMNINGHYTHVYMCSCSLLTLAKEVRYPAETSTYIK